jgi:hypothetical protein
LLFIDRLPRSVPGTARVAFDDNALFERTRGILNGRAANSAKIIL